MFPVGKLKIIQLSHILPMNTRGPYYESLLSGWNYWEKLVAYNWYKIQRPLLFGSINVTSEYNYVLCAIWSTALRSSCANNVLSLLSSVIFFKSSNPILHNFFPSEQNKLIESLKLMYRNWNWFMQCKYLSVSRCMSTPFGFFKIWH